MFSLRNRCRTAWLAIFAILLNAFAPAVSHAMAAHFGVSLLEVCTPDGLKRIAVEYSAARPDIPQGAHTVSTEHCPYCAPHGASFAHTPPVMPAVTVLAGPEFVFSAHRSVAPQRSVWTGGHARAPPSLVS